MAGEDVLTLAPPKADARVKYGEDPFQFVDLRLPKGIGPFPTVINIHGGYWRSQYGLEHAGHLCAALTAKGIATLNLEYRRVGNAGGGWPGTFEDIRSGYRFAKQMADRYKLDGARFLVMGHSAGGQLALCLCGHEPSLTRVVSLAGVVDLERAYQLHLSDDAVVELLGGTPNQVKEHYAEADPMKLSMPKAAQWLIHGVADDIVPPELSRDYVAHKKKAGEDVHLLEIQGADHFAVIDPTSAAWLQIEPTVAHLLSHKLEGHAG